MHLPSAPRPVVLAVGAALATLLAAVPAGCGQQASPDPVARKSGGISAKDAACRRQWRELGAKLDGRDRATEPSALAQRWTNVIATVDYYAASAGASSCGNTLDAQQQAVDALSSYAASLQRWDLQHQLAQVQDAASSYAAKPAPKRKTQGTKAPPPPQQVGRALRTLTDAAPQATAEMQPGWDEAVTAEIGDQAAVKKVNDDLQFLSTDSPSYAAGQQALGVIEKATR